MPPRTADDDPFTSRFIRTAVWTPRCSVEERSEVMKAIWLENQTIRYRDDCPIPQPAVGEALIKIRLAGICGTDLEMCRGYYPFTGIPGHEFVGDVVAAPGALEWVGQLVTGEITIACGTCALCRIGKPC